MIGLIKFDAWVNLEKEVRDELTWYTDFNRMCIAVEGVPQWWADKVNERYADGKKVVLLGFERKL